MTTRSRFIMGLAAGAAIGTVAGLFLAPKTGKETRETVATGANRYWNSIKTRMGRENHYANGHVSEEQRVDAVS